MHSVFSSKGEKAAVCLPGEPSNLGQSTDGVSKRLRHEKQVSSCFTKRSECRCLLVLKALSPRNLHKNHTLFYFIFVLFYIQ